MISAGETATRFVDAWCLYCAGFNQRVAKCTARKKSQTFKATGADVKDIGSKDSCKELGIG